MDRTDFRTALAALTDAELEERAVVAAKHHLDLSARRCRMPELWQAYRDFIDCCIMARARGLTGFAERIETRAKRERAAERSGKGA